MSLRDVNPNILIVGPGAVGIFFACYLGQDHKIWLLTKDSHTNVKKDAEYKISGALNLSSKPKVIRISEIDQVPRENLQIWLCLKAFQIKDALDQISPLLTPHCEIVITSNGLGIYDDHINRLSKFSVIRLFLATGAKKASQHEIILSGEAAVLVASAPEHVEIRDKIAAELRSCGAIVEIMPNVKAAEWSKTVVNCVVNSICTLADRENGYIVTDPSGRQLAEKILTEVLSIAAADGCKLQISSEKFFSGLTRYTTNINSTLVDLRLKRAWEIEYFLGRVIDKAKQYHISAPETVRIYEQLLALKVIAQKVGAIS